MRGADIRREQVLVSGPGAQCGAQNMPSHIQFGTMSPVGLGEIALLGEHNGGRAGGKADLGAVLRFLKTPGHHARQQSATDQMAELTGQTIVGLTVPRKQQQNQQGKLFHGSPSASNDAGQPSPLCCPRIDSDHLTSNTCLSLARKLRGLLRLIDGRKCSRIGGCFNFQMH